MTAEPMDCAAPTAPAAGQQARFTVGGDQRFVT